MEDNRRQSFFRDKYGEPRPLRVLGVLFVGVIGTFIVLPLLLNCITTVPAGHVGIQDTFGTVNDNVLEPGFHLKFPFTRIIPMSVQTQKYIDYGTNDVATIVGLSNEALKTTIGVTMNYHLNPNKAVEVYKTVGTDYITTVLRDPMHTVPRDVMSQYDAKTLYSASTGGADRLLVEQRMGDAVRERINNVGVKDSITIEQFYIRNIEFPPEFTNARTDQMNMETKIKTKQNEVSVQEMESNRMRAEAQGIADANKIIAGSLSEQYLQWYWLETMKTNPKAIYIPVNDNGLPLFKNVDSPN